MDLNRLAQGMAPIQQAMQKAAADRAKAEIEGSAGGGAVRVRIGGDLAVRQVAIAPTVAAGAAADPAMLEDLVAAAVGDALRRWRERYGATPEEQMQKVMAQMDMGALMGMMK